MKPNNQKGGGGRRWKGVLILVVNAAILVLFFEFFGTKGILFWVIGIVILSVWRIFKGRAQFLTTMRYVETMIWSKPLDRDMWDKGEFRERKKQIRLEKQQDIGRKIKLMRKFEWGFTILFIISSIHAVYTLMSISFIAAIVFLIYSFGFTLSRLIYELRQEVKNGKKRA